VSGVGNDQRLGKNPVVQPDFKKYSLNTFFEIEPLLSSLKKILISVSFFEDDVLPFLSHMPWFNPIVEIKLQQVGIYCSPG
jgi:hypothetical protein